MIEQIATVVSVDDEMVWLQAERQSTCNQCEVKQGCGTGLLTKHVGKRFTRIAVEKNKDVTVGQQVQLAIPEQSLLHGAFLMYIVPLALLFIFAAVAQALNFNDVGEIFSGLSGLFIGFYWVRIRLRNNKNGFKARIVEEQK